jgi:hypothetical protein
VPSRITPDLLCDNASELLRCAAAALVSLYVYMNFMQTAEDLPPDEVGRHAACHRAAALLAGACDLRSPPAHPENRAGRGPVPTTPPTCSL